MFLIFDFKYVVREVGRTFVMEHVFWKDRDFKAQLCLWAPSCLINLTQFCYTNSDLARTPELPHPLREKLCTIKLLEWLAMHITFDKNTGGKTSKTKWPFASNLIWSVLKALQDLGSTRFIPGLQLQRQLNYKKCLVPDVVSNAQNSALKKRKMDSNPRYGPGHI